MLAWTAIYANLSLVTFAEVTVRTDTKEFVKLASVDVPHTRLTLVKPRSRIVLRKHKVYDAGYAILYV